MGISKLKYHRSVKGGQIFVSRYETSKFEDILVSIVKFTRGNSKIIVRGFPRVIVYNIIEGPRHFLL